MKGKQAFERWLKRHPDFDWNSYRAWVRAHGYYRSALDVSKPEFEEYAALYLQREASLLATAA